MPLPSMTDLFQQLGLDASEQGIADFIGQHQLPNDLLLADAPYWTEAQRQFLVEKKAADAEWAIIVDQLNESLHEDSVKRQIEN